LLTTYDIINASCSKNDVYKQLMNVLFVDANVLNKVVGKGLSN